MVRGFRTTIVALALLGALVACGDDDGASDASDPVGESTSSASSETSTEPPGAASPSPSVSLDDTTVSPSLPSTTDTVAPEPLPACDSVWVNDQKLPPNYLGCLDGDREVPANGRYCEFGKPIFTYAKRFYAVEGGPVNRTDGPLAQDDAYRTALRKCGG